MRHSAAWLANRMATGVPVPSPQLKVDPVAVVTWRVPVRISLWHTARSNRSIGLLHRLNMVSRARDALGTWRRRCEPSACRSLVLPMGELEQTLPNAATRLHCRRHARKGCRPRRAASSFGQKWQATARVESALAEIPRVANFSIDVMRYRGSRRRRDSFVGASPSEPRPRKVGGTNLRGHLQCVPSHSAGNQA